jgi:serine O-acetyltransferase
MFKALREDIRTVFEKDPAARNILEVILCYPGLHAIWLHRMAHWFYNRKRYTVARIMSHISRSLTGIEIHPGAKIGRKFFIDHGMGIVIGETSDIGDNCLMYQGAVLGGTSLKKGKRHPTLGNDVTIGAGAVVLGPVKIGANARVGAGSVVLKNVPSGAAVVGVPGRIGLGFSPEELEKLDHSKLPDPIADGFQLMLREVEQLQNRIKKLESAEGLPSQIDEYLEKKKKEIEKEFGKQEEK